ncbi:hypothetical protein [Vibrio maritimus]|uniref:hypothetical protein n=1 Tax=Vibrio maritimus TaxID=990268 RepID=UPI001F28C64E|nr:hypothetical protein [Vibrio maritimus]
MRLCKGLTCLFLMCFLPFSYAGSNELRSLALSDAMQAYGNRVEYCLLQSRAASKRFPTTSWFSSLGNDDKKKVLLYLSLDNREKCSEQERLKVVEILDQYPQITIRSEEYPNGMTLDEIRSSLNLVENVDYSSEISGLDILEVQKIQAQFQQPFDLIKVAKKLGLLDEP